MRHAVRILASAVVVIVMGSGCATGGRDDVANVLDTRPSISPATRPPATGATSTPTSDPTPDAQGFGDDTARQSGEGTGGSDLVLVDVRVARTESFDRVVLQFSGTGTPGWVVSYVDQGVLDGSGQTVDLDAGAVLDIYASGTTWPAPDYYDGPRRITAEGGSGPGGVSEAYVGGTFEGGTQVLAGIEKGRVPFRVSTLTRPTRLVVDVAHAGTASGQDQASSPLSPGLLPGAGQLPTRDRLTPWEEVQTPHVRLAGCQPDGEIGADQVIARTYTARIAAPGRAPEGIPAARVRISILQYLSIPAGEAAETTVTGWIRDCRDSADPHLDGAVRQGGLRDTQAGTYGTWVYPAPEMCTDDCDAVWYERMGVLADQGRMVVVSFREVGGPLEPADLDATMRDLMLQAAGGSMPG